MGKEIERKFLIKDDTYKTLSEGILYHQGFLSTDKDSVVRVRIVQNKAWLTIKGNSTGITRHEFEYEIPVIDAEYMLHELCKKPTISKKRYRIPCGDFIWEVDEFLDENEGLVIAEIELDAEDQEFDIPDWVYKEVTGDEKYYNVYLSIHPFKSWG